MDILVFGDSDTSGAHAGGRAWPEMLSESLVARGRGPIAVRLVPFSAASAKAPGFAERKAGEAPPDVIVLLVASFPFTAKFVWLRVERLFGKRAGAWYKRLEDGFEAATKGKPGGRDAVNRLARWAVPKLVGRTAYSTRDQVTANYIETFRALSRFEDASLIVMSYPGMAASTSNAWARRERQRFFADLKSAAAHQHLPWVDGVEIFSGHPREDVMADGFHFNQAGQHIISAAVEQAILGEV